MEYGGYIYILTNKWHTVLYIGVTSNLHKRLFEHRNGITKGFSSQYRTNKLVYYERFDSMLEAITREKQLKGKTRAKKVMIINSKNPDWKDLSLS
jgi:putative endonuclease